MLERQPRQPELGNPKTFAKAARAMSEKSNVRSREENITIVVELVRIIWSFLYVTDGTLAQVDDEGSAKVLESVVSRASTRQSGYVF